MSKALVILSCFTIFHYICHLISCFLTDKHSHNNLLIFSFSLYQNGARPLVLEIVAEGEAEAAKVSTSPLNLGKIQLCYITVLSPEVPFLHYF